MWNHGINILNETDEVVKVLFWHRCDASAIIHVVTTDGWKRSSIRFYDPVLEMTHKQTCIARTHFGALDHIFFSQNMFFCKNSKTMMLLYKMATSKVRNAIWLSILMENRCSSKNQFCLPCFTLYPSWEQEKFLNANLSSLTTRCCFTLQYNKLKIKNTWNEISKYNWVNGILKKGKHIQLSFIANTLSLPTHYHLKSHFTCSLDPLRLFITLICSVSL